MPKLKSIVRCKVNTHYNFIVILYTYFIVAPTALYSNMVGDT